MNNCFKLIVFLVLIGISTLSDESFAQKPVAIKSALKIGMTKSQVQALWGKPDSFVDRELIKESVWTYGDKAGTQKLIFQSNMLVAFEAPKTQAVVVASKTKTQDKIQQDGNKIITAKPYAFMAVEDEKLLDEILKEVPSEEATPQPGASPANGQRAATQVQPGEAGTAQQFFK